ncbi:MAG: 16S rRNA (cytidine(1402)-2'-O)-methyltransferase [Deferribacteres bacterium]|nr:16S rRNA (cytidine(1402)-2'-O)-methyltransferase [Deferribacteres bacterium]
MKGTLYIVSTPIGNLDDITERARRVLSSVDFVVAEDTRRTRILLNALGIRKEMVSFYQPKEQERLPLVLSRLERGESAALVSDAGTPLVSDPGFLLVKEAVSRGIEVVPVPGPSAVLAALVASALPSVPFSFWGYLPKGGERIRLLESLKNRKETLVFFDSPRRIKESLKDILAVMGERNCCVAREVTKMHEEFLRGKVSEVIRLLEDRGEVKGEITLVVEGCGEGSASHHWREKALKLVDAGFSVKEAAKAVSLLFEVPKNEVYNYLVKGS